MFEPKRSELIVHIARRLPRWAGESVRCSQAVIEEEQDVPDNLLTRLPATPPGVRLSLSRIQIVALLPIERADQFSKRAERVFARNYWDHVCHPSPMDEIAESSQVGSHTIGHLLSQNRRCRSGLFGPSKTVRLPEDFDYITVEIHSLLSSFLLLTFDVVLSATGQESYRQVSEANYKPYWFTNCWLPWRLHKHVVTAIPAHVHKRDAVEEFLTRETMSVLRVVRKHLHLGDLMLNRDNRLTRVEVYAGSWGDGRAFRTASGQDWLRSLDIWYNLLFRCGAMRICCMDSRFAVFLPDTDTSEEDEEYPDGFGDPTTSFFYRRGDIQAALAFTSAARVLEDSMSRLNKTASQAITRTGVLGYMLGSVTRSQRRTVAGVYDAQRFQQEWSTDRFPKRTRLEGLQDLREERKGSEVTLRTYVERLVDQRSALAAADSRLLEDWFDRVVNVMNAHTGLRLQQTLLLLTIVLLSLTIWGFTR